MSFNQELAEQACNFFPKYLRHTKGRWGPRRGKLGEKFVLLPWQTDFVSKLFGTLKADGTRQYNTGYLSAPNQRGNFLVLILLQLSENAIQDNKQILESGFVSVHSIVSA